LRCSKTRDINLGSLTVLAALLVFPTQSSLAATISADPLIMVAVAPDPAVVLEGKVGTFELTITNISRGPVTVRPIPRPSVPSEIHAPGEDGEDAARRPFRPMRGGGTCNRGITVLLFPGSTCTVVYDFDTSAPDAHPDDDYGLFLTKIIVDARGGGVMQRVTKNELLRVNDVPEPATFAVVALGLATLGCLCARKAISFAAKATRTAGARVSPIAT
jgi:hypothetical protein